MKNVEERIFDPNRAEALREMLSAFRPTSFIHTAATGMQQPRPDASVLHEVNAELPARLAEVVRQVPNCRVVHISSGLAYRDQGRPLLEQDPLTTDHPYGASKAEAEHRLQTLVMEHPFPLTILRPFSFTGEGDVGSRLFPSLLRSASEKRAFEMSSGEQVRDHSHVNDIARGVIAAALSDARHTEPQIFNLGSADTRKLRDVVTAVVDQLGLDIDLRLGARPNSPDEPMFLVADTRRARTELNWQPAESVVQAVWQLASTSFPSLKLREPRGER
jgi:nucleoside-diphosphate-sugar epimerase